MMFDFDTSRPALLLLVATVAGPGPLRADEPKGEWWAFQTKGYIVPVSQVSVSPRVAGEVVELLAEEGKLVKRGDALARLDAAEQKAALKIAQAEQKLAVAELVKAKGSGTAADVAIAEARVAVARARADLAAYRVECTVVRAPVSGTVVAKRAEVGSRVDPRGHLLSATICELVDLRRLDVELSVQERDVPLVFVGQACTIKPEAFPDASYKGRVVRFLPMADRAKGALGVRVRIEVPAGDTRLRPELGAIVRLAKKK